MPFVLSSDVGMISVPVRRSTRASLKILMKGRCSETKGWLKITQLYFKSDERVPTELKKSIMQARGEKKLTHSQLAQLINEKPQVIQE
ncbi:hypothetical protein F2Q70_00030300 [Brassica cretica]|uniref:HTH cro/C1-type domain-containing protein n=1 Tax=Brassica cretica TaxID=69181 RepID=A0A8S9FKJ3_BRACR|nr:hypothetical protein F2Q70_00030300 [Brassica cretica]